jgi:hypothetical protein
MKDDFTRNIGMVVLLSLGLLALDRLPAGMENTTLFRRSGGHFQIRLGIQKVLRAMHNGGLNALDFQALAAGYYEELRNDGAIAGVWEQDDVRAAGFLRYELKPNLKRSYPAGMRITNSIGMPNPEYGYRKPPHTRRIALLGDSMSLGPYGHSYEALLEDRLNQAVTPGMQRYQVLNFAVYGYSVVQMMDVALEKAPKFQPDVYMVAMTHLEVLPKAGWRTHIARLVSSGADLKYDELRRVVAQAGIQPSDPISTIRIKLAPFFLPVTRWALERIRDHAASQGAQMIVVLVAAPIDPAFSAADLDVLHAAVDKIGVPVIDLRDTFLSAHLPDLQVVSDLDIHPNARGHEMIFENLFAKLRAQPQAWAAVAGNGTDSARKADHPNAWTTRMLPGTRPAEAGSVSPL